MSRWSPRERGLGAALVLAALAAIAVPAWAATESDEAAVEPAADAAFVVPAPAGARDHAIAVRPSAEEREELEEFQRCMREEGVELPAPPRLDQKPSIAPAPRPEDGFRRAAEACGLPEPPHAIAFAAPGEAEADRLSAPPPLPPARER